MDDDDDMNVDRRGNTFTLSSFELCLSTAHFRIHTRMLVGGAGILPWKTIHVDTWLLV